MNINNGRNSYLLLGNVLRVFRLVVCLSPSLLIISDEGEVTGTVCLEALAALVLIVTTVD